MGALHLWMNGQAVGVWEVHPRTGVASLTYERLWQQSPQGRALSLSLPFDADLKSELVSNYFDNLLPDSDHIRRRIRERFRTPTGSAFDLLTAVGRDCVGALQILPPEELPDGWNRIQAEPLVDIDVARILAGVTSPAAVGHREEDDFRVSIAGAQEKTALLRIDGVWHRPRGATPTTHILKLPLGLVGNLRADMTESVENEWLCAQILTAFGLPVAVTEMGRFDGMKALVVERFDRQWQHGDAPWLLRLPQEDFCQAMGQPPHLKYQSDGGPTMLACLQQLRISERIEDPAVFALAQFGGNAWHRMLDIAERVPAALAEVERKLPPGFPETTWQPIANGTRRHAHQFLLEARALSPQRAA